MRSDPALPTRKELHRREILVVEPDNDAFTRPRKRRAAPFRTRRLVSRAESSNSPSLSVMRRNRFVPPYSPCAAQKRPTGQLGTFIPLTQYEDLSSLSIYQLLRYLDGHPGITKLLAAEVPCLLRVLKLAESQTAALRSDDYRYILEPIWQGIARLIQQGVIPPVCLPQALDRASFSPDGDWNASGAQTSTSSATDPRLSYYSVLPSTKRSSGTFPCASSSTNERSGTGVVRLSAWDSRGREPQTQEPSDNTRLLSPLGNSKVTASVRYKNLADAALSCARRLEERLRRLSSGKPNRYAESETAVSNTALLSMVRTVFEHCPPTASSAKTSLYTRPWVYVLGRDKEQTALLRPISPLSLFSLFEMIAYLERASAEKISFSPAVPSVFPFSTFCQEAFSQDYTASCVSAGHLGVQCLVCGARLASRSAKLAHMEEHIFARKLLKSTGIRRRMYPTVAWFPIISAKVLTENEPEAASTAKILPDLLSALLPDIISYTKSSRVLTPNAVPSGHTAPAQPPAADTTETNDTNAFSFHRLFLDCYSPFLPTLLNTHCSALQLVCKDEQSSLTRFTSSCTLREDNSSLENNVTASLSNTFCNFQNIVSYRWSGAALPPEALFASSDCLQSCKTPFAAYAMQEGCVVCGSSLPLSFTVDEGLFFGPQCTVTMLDHPERSLPPAELKLQRPPRVAVLEPKLPSNIQDDVSLLPWDLHKSNSRSELCSHEPLEDNRSLFPDYITPVHSPCSVFRYRRVFRCPSSIFSKREADLSSASFKQPFRKRFG